MALPKKLKDFNLFGNGNNWQGQIPTLDIPELARTMEEYRGGGMDGPVEIDMGQALITFSWTAGGLIAEVYNNYGTPIHDADLLRFTGSYESDETGEVTAVEVVVRGRHKTINNGTAEGGGNNQVQITTTCSYYKLTINDEEIIEIDLPGNIFKVRGVDRLEERRRALGL